ncbi:uncharacterized protein LOC109401138 [Aedes albopictus]|uniref:4Fe-4S ferredoxin-type domain-containing protein n=1 Tax=Aedes albopictus TaxID=7160 RepID=A0ABM1XZ11_AEDAL|nr:uncharacterized protein LOC109401138 [Aedes albopictus]
MEHFWEKLSKEVGPISTTVQMALEQTKFIHSGLVYLDNTTIDYIESDIRRLPKLLNKSDAEVADMLGGYQGSIQDFHFTAGERCVLKMIAAKVKELGFQHFVQEPEGEESYDESSNLEIPVPTEKIYSVPELVPNADEIVDEVKNKIFNYYDFRRENHELEKPFFDRLQLIQVEIRRDYLGDMARVVCPFCDQGCPTAVIIRRDKPGTWKVSNFSGHVKARHDDMEFPGKQNIKVRRCRRRSEKRNEFTDEMMMYSIEESDVKIEM